MLKLNHFRTFAMIAAAAVTSITFTSCDKDDDPEPDNTMDMSMSYEYAFNNGALGEGTAYQGSHDDDLMAKIDVMNNGDNADITVTLYNTVDGSTYMVHAHDAADPGSTPNGTPYNETPNSDVLVAMVEGNGGTASVTVTTNGYSFMEITENYEGFFVVHDPLQTISTTDLTTYLVVGSFARDQGMAPDYREMTYMYDFNTGQIDPGFAYSGPHPMNLTATLKIKEIANNRARVTVELSNTESGETYMIHAHDMADPMNTPNGTPYDETPNAQVLALMAEGNGDMVRVSQASSMSYDMLTTNYDAFFVVHDPLQAITTTDPTTYVVLGVFAN